MRKVNLRSLRRNIGTVMQDSRLFMGDIFSNITISAPSATLDEATSALDNITQKHVADSLVKLNCTRIVIAHRLSTVRECDRILVVAGGNIAEEGTYDELIARDGLFADLVARQRLDEEV